MQTNTNVNIPDAEDTDAASFRGQVVSVAKRFKTNWLDLAKYLFIVKKQKLFKEWGYSDFDVYCAKEIAVKKQTAFKLLSTYYFLTHEEPKFLEEEIIRKNDLKTLPSFESVDILRKAKAKAKKGLSEEGYNNLKEAVLEKSMEPREVGKQFRSMLSAAKSVNPDEERANRRIAILKRFLGTLKAIKREAAVLKILPDKILNDTDKIIILLEAELEQV